MRITIIVAASKNNVIGKANRLPWHISEDLKRVKHLTTGHHIIMGRRSYESIGRPLPHRTNIILTRDRSFSPSGCLVVYSLEQAFNLAKERREDEAFIFGGEQIYRLALPYTHTIQMTRIHEEIEGDAFFPALGGEWVITARRDHWQARPHPFSFVTYKRRCKGEEPG